MKRLMAMMLSLALVLGAFQAGYVYADEVESKVADDALPEEGAEGAANDECDENIENVDNAEVPKVLELSMEDAVRYMKENSRVMLDINMNIKKTKEERGSAGQAKKQSELALKYSGLSTPSQYVEAILSKNDYYTNVLDIALDILEKSKTTADLGLEIQAKSGYYGLLVAEETIEINKNSLAQAEEQLKVLNLKFENGSATKAEVLNGEVSVHEAKTELDSSTDALKLSQLKYLSQLGLPLDTELKLTDREIEYVPTGDIDLNAVLEKAKVDRPEIVNAKNSLEVQEIYTHAVKAYYTSNLAVYKVAEKDLEDAEIAVSDAYEDVELDIREMYQNLVESERKLKNLDQSLELAQEAVRVNKLLYDNGMATSLDVLNANTALTQAQIGRYQVLISYNINKLLFENSSLIGSKGVTYSVPGSGMGN